MSEIILTSEQIEHKLERIAYQILEANGENQTKKLLFLNSKTQASSMSLIFGWPEKKNQYLRKILFG